MQLQNLVVFSHGKESGPMGRKIQELSKVARSQGALTMSVDYTQTMNPSERVQILLNTPLPPHKHLILVGSSMGAYVSTVASATLKPHGLLLLAPAVGMSHYQIQDPLPVAQKIAVVHGWLDDVVLPSQVITWAQKHHLKLVLVNDDHQLHKEIRVAADILEKMLKH